MAKGKREEMAEELLRTAVFVDRDDTIIDTGGATRDSGRRGDLFDPGLVTLLPGVASALRALQAAGFLIVIYSNQGSVARGPIAGSGLPGDLRQVERVNDRMRALLRAEGVTIDGCYWCPFHPHGTVARFAHEHPWRKPQGGMLRAAAEELDIDLARSWAIGDMARDREAAINGGIAPERAFWLRVPDGHGPEGSDATRAVPMTPSDSEVISFAEGAARMIAGSASDSGGSGAADHTRARD